MFDERFRAAGPPGVGSAADEILCFVVLRLGEPIGPIGDNAGFGKVVCQYGVWAECAVRGGA